MDSVFFVTTQQGSWDDYLWSVYAVCSTFEKAEEEKKKLEEKIETIKNVYEAEHGRNYDKDVKDVMGLDKEDRWEKVYIYQAKHEELKFHTILIEERKVL